MHGIYRTAKRVSYAIGFLSLYKHQPLNVLARPA